MKFLFVSLFFSFQLLSQDFVPHLLFENFEDCKESTITNRRFKHKDLSVLLKQLSNYKLFEVKKIGESVDGRDINLVSIGHGKTTVLLWSQMHGNEATATMAMLDIFNFFKEENHLAWFKEILLDELTLHFIPMLNPDGAELYKRRNARDVDLNRDALRLQNPESRILKKMRDSLDATWGFNLHDQNRYYGAGSLGKTASISFLAPAYNEEKDINNVRGNAMKLIVGMNKVLQSFIPNMVGRYSDDFEPRAFGDNIQKWGTSTILVESGGLKNDPEKQYLRQLHFVLLLSSLNDIANCYFEEEEVTNYDSIPYNESNHFHDMIIRKANVKRNGKNYILDIAFRNTEVDFNRHKKYYNRSSITDIGDLSTVYGYEEWDASAYIVAKGKLYPEKRYNVRNVKKLDIISLLKQGYTDFRVDIVPPKHELSILPIHVFKTKSNPRNRIKIGRNPSLLFKKGNTVRFVLVNGVLYDLEKDIKRIKRAFR